MANTANITSANPGITGCFFRAPIGTTLPDNAVDDLDPGFVDQGYVGEDGITMAVTRDTEDIKAYGGDIVYTVQTDYGNEFTLVVYESRNLDTLKTVFGDDNVVEDDSGVTVRHNKARLPRSSFIFEHITDHGIKRQVVAIGQVVSVGDIVHVHTDIVKYELTVKAYPDADGNTIVEYIADADSALGGLQVSTAVLKDGKANEPYTGVNLLAAGGKSPYTWALAAESQLPAGLELETSGAITGTPTEPGRKTFTVEVTDAAGKKATKQLSLTIGAAE